MALRMSTASILAVSFVRPSVRFSSMAQVTSTRSPSVGYDTVTRGDAFRLPLPSAFETLSCRAFSIALRPASGSTDVVVVGAGAEVLVGAGDVVELELELADCSSVDFTSAAATTFSFFVGLLVRPPVTTKATSAAAVMPFVFFVKRGLEKNHQAARNGQRNATTTIFCQALSALNHRILHSLRATSRHISALASKSLTWELRPAAWASVAPSPGHA